MLTSDGSTAVKKQSLQNTSMHVYCTKSGCRTTSISLEIQIDEFPELKDDVIYSTLLSYKDWKMNVLKKEKTVILTLDNFIGCRYVIKCYVRYNSKTLSRAVLAKKIDDDTFILNLFPAIINETKNVYLKHGSLLLELDVPSSSSDIIMRLVTENKVLIKGELSMNEDKDETEEEALVNDITAMLYDSNFSDFRIKARDYTAPVSKSIIAARSKFFFDYLKENPDSEEVEIDASREALKMVLKYMYCGTVYIKSVSTMIEVMKLAGELQMVSLWDLSSDFVQQSMDEILDNNKKRFIYFD